MLSPAQQTLASIASLPGIRHALRGGDSALGYFGRRPLLSIAISVVCVALIGLGAFAYVSSLARATPSWWAQTMPADERARLAKQTENSVITLVHRPQGERWSLEIDESAVNAWIAEKLPAWLNHGEGADTWPPEITELRMIFGDDRLLLAARIHDPSTDTTRVVGATLAPRITDTGQLWIPARRVHIGALDLPGGSLIARTADSDVLPAQLRERPTVPLLLQALAGDRPALESAELRLGDGRRVRVESMTLEDGRATLVCQTVIEPRG